MFWGPEVKVIGLWEDMCYESNTSEDEQVMICRGGIPWGREKMQHQTIIKIMLNLTLTIK